MATTKAMPGTGAFQWNRGAWFGSLVGFSAWLLVGAVSLAGRAPVVAAMWLACGLSVIGSGAWLWGRRGRIRPYPAVQVMLLIAGIAGVLAFAALGVLGPEGGAGLVGSPGQGYRALLIVPGLMAWFALMDRTGRPRPGADDRAKAA